MADMLLDVIRFLADSGIECEDGYNAFRDVIPDTPNNIIALHEYAGGGSFLVAEGVQRIFSVQVRSVDASNAQKLAWDVFNVLIPVDTVIDTRPRGNFWGVVHALRVPSKIRTDESNRAVYGFNVSVITYRD